MKVEWDVRKAETNYRKHGVRFAEAVLVFEDEYAITVKDEESDPSEERFISIGSGAKEKLLVVVYSYRGMNVRLISARLAEAYERWQYEETR